MSTDDQEEMKEYLLNNIKRDYRFQEVIRRTEPMIKLESKISSEELEENVHDLKDKVANIERRLEEDRREIDQVKSIVFKKFISIPNYTQETGIPSEEFVLPLNEIKKLLEPGSQVDKVDTFYNFVQQEVRSGKTEKDIIKDANKLFSNKTRYDIIKKINEAKSQLFDKEKVPKELWKQIEAWESFE